MCFGLGMRQPTPSRKLLIASVGVATINYVAACVHEPETTGNLVAPPSAAGAPGSDNGGVLATGGTPGAGGESVVPVTSGNLVAPPPTATPRPSTEPPTTGNLVPPPEPLPTGGVKPPKSPSKAP